MNCNETPLAKQVYRQPKNYPATKAEAEVMLRASALPNYDDETIGERLSRMIDRPPSPLPEVFVRRLAATAASEPVALGRIFRHALLESRGGDNAR